MQTKEAWQSRANRAGMGRRVQSKRSCRRRQSRRLCIWQFASMRAAQVYGYWQIWCRRGASWCICHGSMSNALQFCRPTIVFVSLLARCNLLGALGASAGRRHRVVGDVVCTLRCLSLGKVPRFRAGADSLLLSVYGPRRSVSDSWWDLCPTAWSAVGSTLHLQQPDWQAAALRMVPRASGSALWALCYVPHTSLFSLCIAFWTIKEHRTHIGELAT